MSNTLFVTWDGGGNLAPALGIAAELQRRHHTVRFLGHAQQREKIIAAGFAFEAFAHARPWSSVEAHPGFLGAQVQLGVFGDRGMGDDLLHAVADNPPDFVVIDCLLFGVLEAAQRAGLKHAVLVHTLYHQQRDFWTTGPGAMMMRLRGFRPPRLWLRANVLLVTTLRELDQYSNVPATLRHTGPVWQGGQPMPATPAPGEPLVLASLSTMYQDGQVQAMQAIVDALATLPVRGLVTTGPSIEPTALRSAANVEIRRYVPHAEVLPQASLVIGHGGHSTAMAALGHDLPLVIMPMFMLGDQPEVGRVLERAGAARVVSKKATPADIASAARAMLADGAHRAAAQALGTLIRQRDGAAEAADVLEHALILAPA